MKCALVVGHRSEARGAYSTYLKRTEYDLNSSLAFDIVENLIDVESKVFFRDKKGIRGVGSRVNLFNPDISIELHFNSFNGLARGTETLFVKENSRVLSNNIQRAMCEALDRHGHLDRGIKKLRYMEKGFVNLSIINKPAVLIEPFFGDNGFDAKLFEDKKDVLIKAIADTIMET